LTGPIEDETLARRDQGATMTTSTSIVNGVDFVSLPTRNFETAVEFYGTVLGLPCSARYGRVDGAEFETGTLTLQVMNYEALGLEHRPGSNAIALHVEDFESARAELESRGVSFKDTIDSGVCLMAPFEDPDGNALMLHHRYAPRPPRP
jgi:catechol 2,3-dioxygenase-like lactoylglutathione lyase family enzyme